MVSRTLGIGQERARGGAVLLLSGAFAKIAVDSFLYEISPEFGVYGSLRVGEYLSDPYFVSWLLHLVGVSAFSAFVLRGVDCFKVALSFLFVFSYLPVTSLYWISNWPIDYAIYAAVFWVALFVLLSLVPAAAVSLAERVDGDARVRHASWLMLLHVGAMALLVLAKTDLNGGFGLGFDSVYDRRASFTGWSGDGVFGYLFPWSVYVSAAYLAFVQKAYWLRLVGVLYVVLVYAASGDKVYIFLFVIMFFVRWAARKAGGGTMLFVCGLLALVGGVFARLGEVWVPTVVNRLLCLPADISYKYVEYFGGDELFYSQSFLGGLFNYSYADVPPRLIGAWYYTDGDNATANFLVDSYVNLGWLGLFPVVASIFLMCVLSGRSRLSILLVPLFVQLLDTPLPTALLTGGGGITLFLIYWLRGRPIFRSGSSSG